MSKYGDDRMHMEDWQDSLRQRASEVGPREAVAEYAQVLQDFMQIYFTRKGEDPK